MLPQKLSITLYRQKNEPHGRPVELTRDELAGLLSRRLIRVPKDGPLWSPARLDPARMYRADANVRGICALVGDVDDGSDPDDLLVPLVRAGVEFLAYSTHSHQPQAPRYRVVCLLAREVSPAEFPAAWRGFVAIYGRRHFDLICSALSQAYFLPSTPPARLCDWQPWACHTRGRLLDPESLMAVAPPTPPPPAPPRHDFPRNGHRPPPHVILRHSLRATEGRVRHYRGWHLCKQLQAHGYLEGEAEPVLLTLQRALEHDGDHPYGAAEARSSLRKAYSEPPLAPWTDRRHRRPDVSPTLPPPHRPAGVPLPVSSRPTGVLLPPAVRPTGVPLPDGEERV